MSSIRKRAARAAVLAGIATALALPAGASAAYTSAISGTTVTLTGDGASDNLVIGEAGGNLTQTVGGATTADFDSATVGDQTVPANTTFTVVVNAGAGDDIVSFTTSNIVTANVNGQDGNDLLGGTDKADVADGGSGNDRLVPARGNDTMRGGAGNDHLVWNNGDGNDLMEGDAGTDEAEVNGSVNAGDTFTIAPNGTRVRFDRTNLGLFNLDIGTSERLTANGLGGNDTMTGAAGLAPLILMALNGGVGIDTITGGDGPDAISGGDENDTLNGAGGNDRVVGDRGDDLTNGGDGDDTMVWNNGDGSDVNNGDGGFDTAEVNGSPTAGDTFVTKANGARVRFDRTNLGPFFLDIGSTERLAQNGLGGADSITNENGLGALISAHVDGGADDDTIVGGDGSEVFFGGSGNDAITGGGGLDVIDAQSGNDTVNSRDGAQDQVRCGDGTDAVTADRRRLDQVAPDCEQIARGAGPRVGIITSNARIVRVAGRAVTGVRLTCPATADGFCEGTLTLRRANGVTIGQAVFLILAGRRATVVVPLRAARLPVRSSFNGTATVRASDLDGALGSTTGRIRLSR